MRVTCWWGFHVKHRDGRLRTYCSELAVLRRTRPPSPTYTRGCWSGRVTKCRTHVQQPRPHFSTEGLPVDVHRGVPEGMGWACVVVEA